MLKNSSSNDTPLNNLFQSFRLGLQSVKSVAPRDYLRSLCLDYQKLGLGFNSGQFHHRRDDAFKESYVKLGILKESEVPTNQSDRKAFTVFGMYSVVFPLKDQNGDVVNLFSIRFKLPKHKGEYLNTEGLYPSYPKVKTTRLFLTENILDAATILQCDLLENRDAVLSLNSGELSFSLKQAIRELEDLDQIIVILTKENTRIIDELRVVSTSLISIQLLDNTTLNRIFQTTSKQGVISFLSNCLATHIARNEDETLAQVIPEQDVKLKLIEHYPGKLQYVTELGSFFILGNLPSDLGVMKVSIYFEEYHSKRKHRNKVDLFDRNQLMSYSKSVCELEYLNESEFETYLIKLTDELEQFRDIKFELKQSKNQSNKFYNTLTPDNQRKSIEFLSDVNLIDRIDDLIESSGVVGESSNRKMLFVIASTYKMSTPLHALVQGSSGSGKSHLINSIWDDYAGKKWKLGCIQSRISRKFEG